MRHAPRKHSTGRSAGRPAIAATAAAAALCATLGACAALPGRDATVAAAIAAPGHTAPLRIGSVPLAWTPDHRDTLALWVDSPPASLPGWRPEFADVVLEAAEAWQGTGAPVRFRRVTDSASADVRVRFRPWQAAHARGATTWATNARGEIVGADVVIVLAPGPRRPPSPACEIRAIALHELGHALGLPHDPSRDAVMFWQTGGPQALTERDRAALRAAYARGATVAYGASRPGA